jgi:hypothetical protein
MDWIERLFGWSPDGGDGSTELMIVLALSVMAAAAVAARIPPVRAYLSKRRGSKAARP